MKALNCLIVSFLACPLAGAQAALRALPPRQVVSLDGTWEIAEGARDSAPAASAFTRQVPVPGLADMAAPPFAEVGIKSALREAFWYRRSFAIDGAVPDIATLKIHKARYGTRVFLNGNLAGEHLPCFTPAYVDLRPHLKGNGAENELLIAIGADRESLPPQVPGGWDFEKYRYIPGIYDSVELILTGSPTVANVQAVPNIETGAVRVVAELAAARDHGAGALHIEVAEAASGRIVASATIAAPALARGRTWTADSTIPLPEPRLWSPEAPFLYELRLHTAGDAARTRFGMRSFRFDPATRRALLNGKTYYMRGSNVCIYRFFEDAERADRPWREDWVRRLHRAFKTMHWNSLRYCIGFPPELWYDIADEEGFLIQDEFPIWLLGKAPETPTAEEIIPQYTEWMRERWNHPCVVIWDAQNESHTEETGKALSAVRHLDLSDRPWENGWAAPQRATDPVEAHPYLFIRGWQGKAPFRLAEMPEVSGMPNLTEAQRTIPAPIIINEYGWLWLTRYGDPTCLTDTIYEGLLGPDSTVPQRRLLYARYLAALTEFWRARRECAGVLHFCGLAYSRPGDRPRPEGGATSDHLIDVENVIFEPLFARHVRDAFSPVGVMLDFWAERLPAGGTHAFNVSIINDLHEPWRGTLDLAIGQESTLASAGPVPVELPPLGQQAVRIECAIPARAGAYTAVATIRDGAGMAVASRRDFRVGPTAAAATGPLRAHPDNPRYFADADGRARLLVGSHTWNNLQDMGPADPPEPFDFDAYLDFLERYHHNFIRLWRWELVSWDTAANREEAPQRLVCAPHPWARTGPGAALDGKPRFDLTRFDDAYFARLRERVAAARDRGIYVSIMLFEGWGMQFVADAWRAHPFHPENNANGVDGDGDRDGKGIEIHALANPTVTAIQEAYVRKVIDTVNDLDNVLYEISNENHPPSTEWQYHFIRFIQDYEKTRPRQHPVGMTFQYRGGANQALFDSPADWVSPNPDAGGGFNYRDNPPPADGRKVVINDTDHLWGIGGNATWVWKSFTRGLNPIFMDPYENGVLSRDAVRDWEDIRRAQGAALKLAERLDLARMRPEPARASSGYCLAAPGAAYVGFAPDGGAITVDLTGDPGQFDAQWLDPVTGATTAAGALPGGAPRELAPPFPGPAVLHLAARRG